MESRKKIGRKLGEISLARLVNQPVQVAERHSKGPYLHVSSLFSLCFRKVHLLWKHHQEEIRTLPLGTLIRFDMGEAVEDKMRQRLAEIGIIEQERPTFIDEEYALVGHADGRLKNGKLLEIKGKDPALFKMTKNYPLRRDQFQVETYLWMDKSQEATLLTFTWGQAPVPIRDQPIRYNVKTVDIIKRNVGGFREANASGPPPDRICRSIDEKTAILCPMRYECFRLPCESLTTTIEEQLKAK